MSKTERRRTRVSSTIDRLPDDIKGRLDLKLTDTANTYEELSAWLKEEGDTVAAGEPLFEIETNKVVNQVEATVSGVLKKQLAEEGDTVRVDTAVAVVEAE